METLGSEVRKTMEDLQPSQLSNVETGCILLLSLGALTNGFFVASCHTPGRESLKTSPATSSTPLLTPMEGESLLPSRFLCLCNCVVLLG